MKTTITPAAGPSAPTERQRSAGDLLNDLEVAGLLAVAPATLRNWRSLRPPQGPAFIKIGRRCVRYRRDDVDAFIRAGESAGCAA